MAGAAFAQDPLKTLPDNYKLIFENADVAVIRAHYGPREKVPVHDHTSFATVFVYLNDSRQVRIDHQEADGKGFSVTRPPTVTGAYRVAPGVAERHSIENLGDTSSDFLRVELKRVDLKMKEPFRGKAPASLTASSDVVEFDDPSVQVERIICVAAEACAVKAATAPSLVIAISAVSISGKKLEVGQVQWLLASQSEALAGYGVHAVHALRILLPGNAK